jgi:ketosteroid isomerase-like protein
MEDRSPVGIARAYLASFGSGDPDAIAALVSDDFRNEHLSELGAGSTGRDEYRSRLAEFLGSFVGARYTVEAIGDLVRPAGVEPTGGREVVARYRFEAEYDGVPIEIAGVMWFEVDSGLITRRTDLWDSLTFLRQTGLGDRPVRG